MPLWTKKKQNNSGFTMMEMIIVVAIIAILITVSAFGIRGYLRSADKLERQQVAETTFLALQNHMTQLKQKGQLSELNEQVNRRTNDVARLTCSDQLKTVISNYYSSEDYDSRYEAYCRNHEESTIVTVVFSNADKEHPFYDILFRCLGNEDLLENAFAIEYNQTTGVVMSVFYSKSIDAFSPATMYDDADLLGKGNVVLRDIDSLDEKEQGYYGVINTALNGVEVPPVDEDLESSLSIVNSDRVYLTFTDDAAAANAGAEVCYEITLFATGADNTQTVELGKISYSVADMHTQVYQKRVSEILDLVDSETAVTPDAERAVRLTGYSTAEGETDKYFMVLDCDDLYRLHAGLRYDLESGKYASAIQALNTPVEQLAITATMAIYVDGALQGTSLAFPGSINPVFASYDADYNYYGISCTRHLNNIRDFANNRKYILCGDVNLLQYEREEFVESLLTDEESGLTYLDLTQEEVASLTAAPGDVQRHCFSGFDQIKCRNALGSYEKTKFVLEYLLEQRTLYTYANGRDGFVRDGVAGEWYWVSSGGTRQRVERHQSSGNRDGEAVLFRGMLLGVKEPTGELLERVKAVCEDDPSYTNSEAYDALDQHLAAIDATDCYTITGLYNSDTNMNFNGLFACVSKEAVVGGLGFEDCSVTGCSNVGLICGVNQGHVSGIFAKNVSVSGRFYLGGLMGRCETSVSNLHISGSLSVTSNAQGSSIYFQPVGGLFGSLIKDTLMTSCLTTSPTDIKVTNCSVDCLNQGSEISSQKSKAIGGIAGEAYAWIDNCTVACDKIMGCGDTAGVAGKMYAGVVSNCTVSVGEISCYDKVCYGGIVGSAGDYSLVNVITDEDENALYIRNTVVTEETNVIIRKNGNPNYVGGMVGKAINLRIYDSAFNGNVVLDSSLGTATVNTVGGILGNSYYNVVMERTSFGGKMIANSNCSLNTVGGFIGTFRVHDVSERDSSASYSLTMKDCTFTGSFFAEGQMVNNMTDCGLLVGYISSENSAGYTVVMDGCKVMADTQVDQFHATGTLNRCGGMLGYMKASDANSSLTITNGQVSARIHNNGEMQNVGGYIGKTQAYKTSIVDCAVTDFVMESGKRMYCVGGIVGITQGNHLQLVANQETVYTPTLNSKANSAFVGGLIGACDSSAQLKNLIFAGNITAENLSDASGGIVGKYNPADAGALLQLEGTIQNAGNITTTGIMKNAGGVIGVLAKGSVTFTDAISNKGLLTAGGDMNICGGIFGEISAPVSSANWTFSDYSNEGAISSGGNANNVGGLIGRYMGSSTLQFIHAENKGSITAGKNAGNDNDAGICGLVAYAMNSYLVMTDCSNEGSLISGGTMKNSAGILGRGGGNFTNCSSSGVLQAATGMTNVSGMVAWTKDGLQVHQPTKMSGVTNQMTITNTTSGKMHYVGGCIAIAEYALEITDAINEGNFTGAVATEMDCIGGIVASSRRGITLTNAVNNGDITSSKTLKYSGGIIAEGCGNITNVTNNKSLSANTGMMVVGAIMGQIRDMNDVCTSMTISNCTMHSVITNTTSGNVEAVGGVLGRHALESSDTTVALIIDGVKGDVQIINQSSGDLYNVGGMIGYYNDANSVVQLKNSNSDVFQFSLISQGIIRQTGGSVGYMERATSLSLDSIVITGKIEGSKRILNCSGLVGYVKCSATLTKSINGVNITSSADVENAGGLVGKSEGAASLVVTDCANNATISSDGNMMCTGGIVGYAYSSADGSYLTVEGSVNNLNLYSKGYMRDVGGVVGKAQMKSASISSCAMKNSLLGEKGLWSVGGILGFTDNDCTIYSITMTEQILIQSNDYVKVVGGIVGGSFRNLIIHDVDCAARIVSMVNPSGEESGVGGIVGRWKPQNAGTDPKLSIGDNVKFTGTIETINGMDNTGGILGYVNGGTVSLYQVRSEATITAGAALSSCGGAVGYMKACTVSVEDATYQGDITATSLMKNIGGLLGNYESSNALLLKNCNVSGNIRTSADIGNGSTTGAGGIVGYSRANCSMETCSFTGDITSGGIMTRTGGLLGSVDGEFTASQVTHTGIFTSTGNMSYVGGIAGYLKQKVTIDTALHSGEIHSGGTLSGCGGILGNCEKMTYVVKATNHGNLIADSTAKSNRVAGIVGCSNSVESAANSGAIMEDCVNTGDIVCRGEVQDIGGLYSHVLVNGDSRITHNYSTGDITYGKVASVTLGGLFGYMDVRGADAEVKENYFGGNILCVGEPANYSGGYIAGYINATNAIEISTCYAVGEAENLQVPDSTYCGKIVNPDNLTFTSPTSVGDHNNYLLNETVFRELLIAFSREPDAYSFDISNPEAMIQILLYGTASGSGTGSEGGSGTVSGNGSGTVSGNEGGTVSGNGSEGGTVSGNGSEGGSEGGSGS